LALDPEHGDVVAYFAYASDEGESRITFCYIDGSTKTFDAGLLVDEGDSSESPTWWR
jgi:hypothetical protein